MPKVKIKRINKILTLTFIILIIIFSLSRRVLGIDNYGDSESQIVNSDFDNSSNNFKIYTVEDIIYNRIPFLDVNVFSKTAGGQEVIEGSLIQKERAAVASWYVSIRNISIIALTMILIFVGIKMAISTISNDKAKYKQMLITWIKALAIILLMHYLMYIILDLNEWLVSIMATSNSKIGKIYETIKRRAYDVRFSIGMPATVMYVVLVIFFVRYFLVYVRRYFTVMILIIIAPFITVKYAIESTGKKESGAIRAWIYDFTINVFLQSIHALIYTSLISIGLDLASTNIMGFIIALIIMNFSLEASSIFTKIFKFAGTNGTGIAKDASSPFSPQNVFEVRNEFAKFSLLAAIPYSIGKGALKFGYNGITGLAEDITKKPIRRNISNKRDAAFNGVDKFIGKRISKFAGKNKGKQIENLMELKINARKKGKSGKEAKKVLAKYRKNKKEAFTSNFKFVTDVISGTASVIIGIPMIVAHDDSSTGKNSSIGLELLTGGINKLKNKNGINKYTGKAIIMQGMTLGGYGYLKGMQDIKTEKMKKQNKVKKAIETVNNKNKLEEEEEAEREKEKIRNTERAEQYRKKINEQIVELNEELDKLKTPEEIKEVKKAIEKIKDDYHIDTYELEKKIKEKGDNKFTETDDKAKEKEETIKEIEDIMEKSGILSELDSTTRKNIVNTTYEKLENASGSKEKNMAKALSDAIIETTAGGSDSSRYKSILNKFNGILDIGDECKDTTGIEIFNYEKFIKNSKINNKEDKNKFQ